MGEDDPDNPQPDPAEPLLDAVPAPVLQKWYDEEFEGMAERVQFLQKVAEGTTEFNAGIEVGWTPNQTRKACSEPDFRQLIEFAREQADGTIEHTLFTIAHRGNLGAIQMWLYNRQASKWKDVKRIEVTSHATVSLETVHSVKVSALELIRERGVAALQSLGPAAIEATSSE